MGRTTSRRASGSAFSNMSQGYISGLRIDVGENQQLQFLDEVFNAPPVGDSEAIESTMSESIINPQLLNNSQIEQDIKHDNSGDEVE